jgi:hypothetical protein
MSWKTMRGIAVGVLVVVTWLLSAPPAWASLVTQFDFASEPSGMQAGAYIEFKGGPDRTVTFPDGVSGYDFVITQSDVSSLIGIKGNIGGTFTVGTISTVGLLQTAPLTGTGTFSLTDSGNNVLSATLVWNDIYTYVAPGGLNPWNTLNLTNWTYSGSDPAFLDILAGTDQTSTLSFQFSPGKTLTQLMATGSYNLTTYSGSFSMVPEPATMALLGIGSAMMAAVRLRRRRRA